MYLSHFLENEAVFFTSIWRIMTSLTNEINFSSDAINILTAINMTSSVTILKIVITKLWCFKDLWDISLYLLNIYCTIMTPSHIILTEVFYDRTALLFPNQLIWILMIALQLLTFFSKFLPNLLISFVCSLQAMRAKVWKARLTSPLFNCGVYAKNMERLFWQMWQTCSKGLPPQHVASLD